MLYNYKNNEKILTAKLFYVLFAFIMITSS